MVIELSELRKSSNFISYQTRIKKRMVSHQIGIQHLPENWSANLMKLI